MADSSKRAAQEALFRAIKDQAESNMKSALKATEKAQLLVDLAEAYRLTAGGVVAGDRGAGATGGSGGSSGRSSGEASSSRSSRPSDDAGSRDSGGQGGPKKRPSDAPAPVRRKTQG
jgi:hypothetical protein